MPSGRVRIENGTVVTGNGSPMRGGVAWVYKYGEDEGLSAYANDPAYYRAMRAAGMNAVRLVCFDPWQRSNGYPHYDFTDIRDLQKFLGSLDNAVKHAAAAGLYVMINYHDIGTSDPDFANAFWRAVAPRYAGHTHVFYELLNEPAKWFPEDYSDAVIGQQLDLYRMVRAYAPDTHIVMLTFANVIGFVPQCTMESVASRLDGVDWSNASIGFHPYRTGGSSSAITALRKLYPVINTEQNIPFSHGGADYIQPMDGHDWGTQTMEALGISWFAWEVEGPEKFQKNFVGGILADARSKGYLWRDQSEPRWLRALTGIRNQLSDLPVGEWNRIMGLRWSQVATIVTMNLGATLFDVCMLALLMPMLQGAVFGKFGWLDGRTSLNQGQTLVALASFAFLMSMARNALLYATHMYNARLYSTYSRNLSVYAFEQFLRFGKSYFDSRETGHLNTLIDRHHDVLNLYQPAFQAISITLLLMGHFSIMLWISWRMTLLALLLFPIMTLTSRWVVARATMAQQEIRKNENDLGRSAWRMLAALPLFRAFAREEHALRDFVALTGKRQHNSIRLWRARGLSSRILDVAVQGSVLAMLTFAFTFEPHAPTDITRLLVFFFVARVAAPEVAKYHDLAFAFAEKLPGAREFATLFDRRDKFLIPEGKSEMPGLSNAIEFRSLTFQYPAGPVALSGVSFRMEKGTMTAIVGPTGSGKSTLTHLLLRFYDVPPGSILVDGADIREFTFASVRRNISIVSQNAPLLNASLRENLMFGASEEASDERIEQVAADTQLDDVIASLPEGWDTILGEHGGRLSGGQRQRVAIARAILKHAPLLILDEATSALDSLTEARLQEAIGAVVRGCTSLVIAHRLSTIRRADRIIVLEQGRVVEQGTLTELIENRGLFHRMWEQQAFG